MNKQVYVALYICGQYSDYTEKVLGISDDENTAIGYCYQDYGNEDWNSYDQGLLVVRSYALNVFDPDYSQAQRIAENHDDYKHELTVFEGDKWLAGEKAGQSVKKYTLAQAWETIQEKYGYQNMDFDDSKKKLTREEFDEYVKTNGEYLTNLFNRAANGELDDDDDDDELQTREAVR